MSYHLTNRLRSTRALLLAFAIAGALVGFLVASQGASGYGVNYCVGWIQSGASCEGPNHTLVANVAWDGGGTGQWVCEIAQNGSGQYIGGWGCGSGSAETCYPGNQLLHGWIANGSPYWLYEYGTEYVSQGCP